MNNINNIIGENIKKYRLLNNMTQEELSKKLGIAPNTLSNYENGNREPNSDVISKLADIFDISLDELYGRKFTKEEAIEIAASTKNNLDLSDISNEDKEAIMRIIEIAKNKNKKD